jgi:nitrate/TMAO reductase-like tetraheme cytochrome c subunit
MESAMRLVVFAIISSAVISGAWADDRVLPVRDAATKKECGSCHMAFQPGLLPAGSWTGIMDGLADHFGEDASLPEDLAARIRAYLVAHAGRGDERVLRITEQQWWMREHRKVRAAEWNKPQVKAKSNCPACHLGAEQGSYEDEDD